MSNKKKKGVVVPPPAPPIGAPDVVVKKAKKGIKMKTKKGPPARPKKWNILRKKMKRGWHR